MRKKKGFKWIEDSNVRVKGVAYYKDKLLESEELLKFLKKVKTIEEFELILKELNGFFLICIKFEEFVVIAVDKLRAIPCYYKVKDGNISIFDEVKEDKIEIEPRNLEEFKLTGYVTSNGTLLKNVFQIKAATYLKINKKNDNFSSIEYYNNFSEKFSDLSYNQNYSNIKKILDNVGKRLTNSLNGRMAVIPLSGGYDSRLVLDLLHRNNYKNIVCYTYGRKNSREVETSKAVAEKLGYKWIFIEYTKENIDEAWKEYTEFRNEVFDYASIPHVQDFVALYHMQKNNLISKNSIIIPGHSGDLLGGSHLLKLGKSLSNEIKGEEIHNHLYKTHYHFKKDEIKYFSFHMNKIKEELKGAEKKINKLINLSDYWNINNRQSKFIINSLRSYEYFGYEWRVPLWDSELADYFYSLNLEFKTEKIIYNDVLEDLFKENSIDFNLKRETINSKINKIFRKILPEDIKVYLKKKLKKKVDFNNFDYIGEKLGHLDDGFKYHINSSVILNLTKELEEK